MFEIKVPVIGESVTYAELTNWLVTDGSYVEKDQDIAEFDSDKASFTLSSEEAGIIKILVQQGKVNVGDVIAEIDTSVSKPAQTAASTESPVKKQEAEPIEKNKTTEKSPVQEDSKTTGIKSRITPVAEKMIIENHLSKDEIGGDQTGKVTKNHVFQYLNKKNPVVEKGMDHKRESTRKELSTLRKKLAERLVQAKNQMAMLTTYNEVDMSRILEMRKKSGDDFLKKYGLKLGLMSFFAKAATIALREFPEVNSSIDNDFQEFHHFVDLGIAVSTDKGLTVPVIRNAETLSIPELESQIQLLADKARLHKISIDEMTGGTFTITNGGVFGSLFSTPIINPPQAAILGMHKIQERVVGIQGRIELRPMMYLALTYDHRVIDGKDSVTFLVRIKELLEEPCKMALDGVVLDEALLGL